MFRKTAFIYYLLLHSIIWGGIPHDLHVLEPKDSQFVIEMISEADTFSLYGAIKIHPNFLTTQKLEKAFCNNPLWYIGIETRHSLAEVESIHSKINQSTAKSQPVKLCALSENPQLKHKLFSFRHCNNAHPKFFLSHNILLIGTTNMDDLPRNKDGKPCELWYGSPENVTDFLVVIRDKTLIRQFVSRLTFYLPPSMLAKLQKVYTDIPPAQSLPLPQKQFQKIQAQPHLSQTMFVWGPVEHKQLLSQMIHKAKRHIHIYQQDLQDKHIQQALLKASQRGVKIKVIMSKTPFSRAKENPAIPFLQTLHKISQGKARTYLTGCKNALQPRHIHAKFLKADNIAYVGSANFFSEVLDDKARHLNVGIITTDQKYIRPIMQRFKQDKQIATSLSRCK